MTTDTLNHACSLKEEIDRLNELIERVKDKYFVRISFSRYTGVITNEDIEAVRANLTELIRTRATVRLAQLQKEFDNL
ncbi:hypothetical protein EEL40_00485 [Muribaculaceae bacterium Isolate-083 (Janvier)]|jgi:CRISPR/Cas system-associated endoribonuclease Cas2|nr:hypothetical protein EEL40_00485 [Muribaculaceae bacterium Isolate-083 (Janvier)]